jgi:triacylglycerol esterase/lipase EstA (alpha/beta hydrolase family)
MGMRLRTDRALRGLRRIGLAVAIAAGVAAGTPTAASADVTDLLPSVSPPGANDFTCRPTTAHPAPVVLVHGTFEGAADNWSTVSPQLKSAGYCVFALEYGDRGTGDIAASAGELARFVDAVLGATGARKVSLVGHSQGGMMPRHYVKFLGGATKVDDLVGLAPSNHGTTNPGAFVTGATVCEACDQQRAGSAFLQQLNAGDETPGRVSYTVVQTRYDEVVTPYTSAFLDGGDNTTNILLQDACPSEVIDHHFMPHSRLAIRWTLQALEQPGPAVAAIPPSCL